MIKYKYSLISLVLLLGLLAFLAPKQIPIPTGDAEDYWEFSCGVELKKFDGYFPYTRRTGIFSSIDGWYFYYYQEHHGRHVFKVNKQALLNQTGEVFSLLENEITDTVQKLSHKAQFELKNTRRLNCLKIKNEVSSNEETFIDKINSQVKTNKKELMSFQLQWNKSKLYWMSILFEAIFLSFWWLFTFSPGLFGRLNKKLLVRLALSPLILLLPHYLGYAPFLYSSGASGGILYPVFALLVSIPLGWLPYNSIDIEILNSLPRPFLYMSQVPFSPMAISFKGGVTPTALLIYSALVFFIGLAFKKVSSSSKSNTKN